jgi:beta-glucosidase
MAEIKDLEKNVTEGELADEALDGAAGGGLKLSGSPIDSRPSVFGVDFAQPAILAVDDKSETVELTFDPYYLASYDYTEKKVSGGGYVLEAGTDYKLYVGKNAHDRSLEIPFSVNADITFNEAATDGYQVENRFDDIDDQLGSVLSRNDWDGTMPSMRSTSEKTVTKDFIDTLRTDKSSGNPLTADSDVVKKAAANRAPATVKSRDGLQLYELRTLDADNELWDEMMKRITASSLVDLTCNCAFKSPSLDYIGKPETIDTDGPAGFTKFMGSANIVSDTCVYACEPVIAATWNVELAKKMGNAVGNEGLIGYADQDTPYSGWYAPGVNIHRTPFGGRNPEYYSEDGILNGQIAAAVVKGAAEKGVYAFVKHFAVNDQETHRGGVCTWLTEQSLREIYLRPFEIVVKEGGALALMSSFNRIGTKWTGGDYRLMTEVLRGEWGFNGMALCDFASSQSHMNYQQMIYAGGDAWLDTVMPTTSWFDKDNTVDVYVMQQAVKHILYTVANSNAMNGIGEGVIYTTQMAYWRIVLIAVDIVVPVLLIAWGVLVILKAKKKE